VKGKGGAEANEAASTAAGKVAEDEKKLKEDEEAAGPFAAIAQQKQAALSVPLLQPAPRAAALGSVARLFCFGAMGRWGRD